MRERPFQIMLAAALVAGGVVALSVNLSDALPDRVVIVSGLVVLLGVLSLVLFGTSQRWWLLPLGCALATAGTLQLLGSAGLTPLTEPGIPSLPGLLLMLGVSLLGLGGPFVGIYLNTRTQWGWLLPGYLLWVIGGLLVLLGLSVSDGWLLATLVLWGLAALFFVIFLGNRDARWSLTPGYVLWVLGTSLQLRQIGDALPATTLVTWLFWAAALILWMAYLRDSQHFRRLLAAGVLSLGGALPLLLSRARDLWYWLGVGVSVGVALAWLLALLRQRDQEQIV